ncbi:acyl-protein synthetase [Selenomonas sp. oral taxon 138]|uniref:LuxE/PaaK family acyltransferase n=1 Tax=Selenomonas sp. oral taxon 138 TaxID=712532 RepID=UPI0002A1B488|nr:acyl-protein synthetase [Selenomonas sp. oral taxon 138]EKX96423.1 Acyl-protein synthetase, LuxE [Selenomonas sp. oral taxon 138 str. F0429]
MTYEEVLALPPFGVAREEKKSLLREGLLRLTEHHRAQCAPYARMMEMVGFSAADVHSVEDVPFLPVRLFKEMELRSVAQEDVFKTMTSSGTTGQQVSRIFLDRATATNQQKTLVRIVSEVTGSARLPMIILDCPSVVRNRAMFSARGAGILGFSMFGRKKIYALNDAMELQLDALQDFIEEHKGEKILLFGFTFMVWQHFYKALKEEGKHLDLSNSVLIHGGGWKKLAAEAVEPAAFRAALREVCGDMEVADYYGMVEQTGCIYLECEEGHLHASTYSDVIVRRPLDFSLASVGERGILEVVSLLPESYPGHALLTEDEGVLLGEDDCPCGRKGKYFKVLGRLKQAELRGCSDTYAAAF